MIRQMLNRINIRHIEENADFRNSDMTNYDLFYKRHKLLCDGFRKDDGVLFLNGRKTKGSFIFGYVEIKDELTRGAPVREILTSVRFVMRVGEFHFTLVEQYANRVGLTIGNKAALKEALGIKEPLFARVAEAA